MIKKIGFEKVQNNKDPSPLQIPELKNIVGTFQVFEHVNDIKGR